MSKSPLDLNQLLPNYFNKKLFRSVVVIIIFLFLFTAWSNGWKNEFPYIECPIEAFDPCVIDRSMITNSEHIPEAWDGIVLTQGEFIGEKPNEHYFLFQTRVWLIIFITFLLNHFNYWLRTGSFKPRINKKNWEKLKKLSEEEIK